MANLEINEMLEMVNDDEKFQYLFGTNFVNHQIYKTKEEAESQMKTLLLNVWALDDDGNKYPAKRELKVHSKIADMVYLIFEEIFHDEEKFPINLKEFGAFNWRYAGRTSPDVFSEHSHGIAIDINYYDNPYYRDGEIVVGRSYEPYINPYAITPESSVVRIFKKFGWVWGGEFPENKDYMHFHWYSRGAPNIVLNDNKGLSKKE